jgi:conjugative transfer signal peptidase TraF
MAELRLSGRHLAILALAAASVAPLFVVPSIALHPLIIFNGSGSAPLGFYRIENRSPRLGDTVVVRPSKTNEALLVERGILPAGVPLLKRVAAAAGDEICRDGTVISINGADAEEALEHDNLGRPMPVWQGCRTLSEGEFFLLQPHPYSVDSRYFGPIFECQILGVASPVWTWNPDE